MNKVLIIFTLALAGCAKPVPVTYKFPLVPSSLMEPAPELVPLPDDKRELSDLLENANENYGNYHDLVIKYNSWQEWYKKQKEINNTVK